MKQYEFHKYASSRRWDYHREFYVDHGAFTVFESGEVILNNRRFDPCDRRGYPELGVRITASTDARCPDLMLPDGTPAPRAWLSRDGIQLMLVDNDTKRAYPVHVDYLASVSQQVPDKARGAMLYWANHTAEPVAVRGGKLRVSRPADEWKKANSKKLKEIRAACIALDRMDPSPFVDAYAYPLTLHDIDVASFITTLGQRDIARIAHRGFVYPLQPAEYDYLLVKE